MGQSPHKLNITKIPAISTNFFNIIKKREEHQLLSQKVLILLFERNGSMGQV